MRLFWLALFLAPSFAIAQDAEPTTFLKGAKEKSVFDRLWASTRIYENEDNRVVQSFGIVGRYHGQGWSVAADQGSADGWENRRMIFGAESVLFRELTVQAQIRVSEDFSPFYDGIYQAFVRWSPNESLSISAGRLDFLFGGLERTKSSNRIVTFERGLLADQLTPAEVVGLSTRVNANGFTYRVGLFSGSIGQEFTSFEGGVGAGVGMEHALHLFFSSGKVHLDYLFNDGHSLNDALAPYDHVLSMWHEGRSGPFAMGVDVMAGNGLAGTKSVLGATVLPTYDIRKGILGKDDALQAVLRWQYAVSDGEDGLQLQSRYQQEVVPSGLGDQYHAVYGGLNYMIYKDRFKTMFGAEYSVMNSDALGRASFKGWTYMAGARAFF